MRAIAHPARVRILSLLLPGPLSATQIAVLIGIAPGTASYHLGRLARAGLVRVEDARAQRVRAAQRCATAWWIATSPASTDRAVKPPLTRRCSWTCVADFGVLVGPGS
jgi:DNA-binding CsgD family transcriptional regulator